MSTYAVTSETLKLSIDLISRRSITPEDAGCQDLIAERLKELGFAIEPMPFGSVKNLWARRGKSAPLFVFAGHTDVVPPGPDYTWKHPPFKAIVDGGILWGRGAADMKTAIAAMTTACERFLQAEGEAQGSIAFLLTSNEEGDAQGGTKEVMAALNKRGEKIDYCVVGEATSTSTVGDTIKSGRRGSLTCRLKVKGAQGHVAYPDRGANPIHLFSEALAELCQEKWCAGNQFFSPTTMQFSNLNSGTGADNVIPPELETIFNFRFSSELTAAKLQERTEAILKRHKLNFEAVWHLSGDPFLTQPGELIEATSYAVEAVTGKRPQLSTSGGTSDARFIAPSGAQVIELGLINATIHKADEQAALEDIETLSAIYEKLLRKLLSGKAEAKN